MTAKTNLPRITLHEDNGGGIHILADHNDHPERHRHNCTIYYHLQTINGEPDADEDGRSIQSGEWEAIGQSTIESETLPDDSILEHPETRQIATFVNGHWQRTAEPIGSNGRWYLGLPDDE